MNMPIDRREPKRRRGRSAETLGKAVVASFVLWGAGALSISAEEATPAISLLKARRIDATPPALRAFLRATFPEGSSLAEARDFIKQLGDDEYAVREQAVARLLALTNPPVDLLEKAAQGDDPEIRRRARLILGKVQRAVSPDPLLFAAFTTIRDRQLPGLAEELLRAIPLCVREPVRVAAEQALQATATEADEPLLRRHAAEGDPAARAAARAALAGAPREAFEPVGWRQFFDSYLVAGQNEGERTEFVKGAPESLAAHFRLVTRNASTINSVESRHGTSPWLYPVRGKNEAPRVLATDAARYYPVWGQWRQRWGEWVRLNENGGRIEGAAGGNVHSETEVDYYVVPMASR